MTDTVKTAYNAPTVPYTLLKTYTEALVDKARQEYINGVALDDLYSLMTRLVMEYNASDVKYVLAYLLNIIRDQQQEITNLRAPF